VKALYAGKMPIKKKFKKWIIEKKRNDNKESGTRHTIGICMHVEMT
jgi:hypothetical protein